MKERPMVRQGTPIEDHSPIQAICAIILLYVWAISDSSRYIGWGFCGCLERLFIKIKVLRLHEVTTAAALRYTLKGHVSHRGTGPNQLRTMFDQSTHIYCGHIRHAVVSQSLAIFQPFAKCCLRQYLRNPNVTPECIQSYLLELSWDSRSASSLLRTYSIVLNSKAFFQMTIYRLFQSV